LQVEQLLWQGWQTPAASMYLPLLQVQTPAAKKALALQLVHWLLLGPLQLLQLLWQAKQNPLFWYQPPLQLQVPWPDKLVLA
jgi:hypothetical protein